MGDHKRDNIASLTIGLLNLGCCVAIGIRLRVSGIALRTFETKSSLQRSSLL